MLVNDARLVVLPPARMRSALAVVARQVVASSASIVRFMLVPCLSGSVATITVRSEGDYFRLTFFAGFRFTALTTFRLPFGLEGLRRAAERERLVEVWETLAVERLRSGGASLPPLSLSAPSLPPLKGV